MEILIAILGILAVLGVMLLYGGFSWGWVVYKFYYWFIFATFTGLPDINYWQAIGIGLFISLFKGGSHQVIKKEYVDQSSTYVTWLGPWIVLFVGWMFKHIIS